MKQGAKLALLVVILVAVKNFSVFLDEKNERFSANERPKSSEYISINEDDRTTLV